MIPLLDVQSEYQSMKRELNEAVQEVMASGSFILGPRVAALEAELKQDLGVSCAYGVANGTDALQLALEAAGIGVGDEVITTPFSFFATAEVIVRVGARPVFVDVHPDTFNLDADKLAEAITARTKAVIVVHLFGQCASMQPMMEIAQSYGLLVIEDACQSISAQYRGCKAGSMGHIGCFSFYPTKNLGGFGDGGMVVTRLPDIGHRIEALRNHGSYERYVHQYIGQNSRLDELQAAILLVKWKKLSEFIQQRITVAQRYTRSLHGVVKTPVTQPDRNHVFHQYSICSQNRDRLRQDLQDHGIATGIYYPIPLHLQPALRSLGYQRGDFPVAERIADTILALPIHPFLTREDQDEIIETVIASERGARM